MFAFMQTAPADESTVVDSKPAGEAPAAVGESTAEGAKKLIRSASVTMNDATVALGDRVAAATEVVGQRVGTAATEVSQRVGESAAGQAAQKFIQDNPAVKEALNVASEKAGEATAIVGARMGVARSGQQLVSNPDGHTILSAKKVSTEVVSSDVAVLTSAQATLKNFHDAAQKLREAAQVPDVEGISKQDFARLAEEYEAKAKVYEQIVKILESAPAVSAPPATPAEQDGFLLLHAAASAGDLVAAGYPLLTSAATVVAENVATLSAAGYTAAANYLASTTAAPA